MRLYIELWWKIGSADITRSLNINSLIRNVLSTLLIGLINSLPVNTITGYVHIHIAHFQFLGPKKQRFKPDFNLQQLKTDTANIAEKYSPVDNKKKEKIASTIKLLLVVVTESEFRAALLYLNKSSNGKQFKLSQEHTQFIYYVGKWGDITAALVRQDQEGVTSVTNLTCSAIRKFKNLKAIISLGVCGCLSGHLEMGSVIVPKQVLGYRIVNEGRKLIFSQCNIESGKTLFKYLVDNLGDWSYQCNRKKLNNDPAGKQMAKAIAIPIVSGQLKINNYKLRDKLRSSIAAGKEKAGIEMEGLGIWDGITYSGKTKDIEFIVVKAVSDYSDEKMSGEWQPFAACAAADFVYAQLNKEGARKWFCKGKL